MRVRAEQPKAHPLKAPANTRTRITDHVTEYCVRVCMCILTDMYACYQFCTWIKQTHIPPCACTMLETLLGIVETWCVHVLYLYASCISHTYSFSNRDTLYLRNSPHMCASVFLSVCVYVWERLSIRHLPKQFNIYVYIYIYICIHLHSIYMHMCI